MGKQKVVLEVDDEAIIDQQDEELVETITNLSVEGGQENVNSDSDDSNGEEEGREDGEEEEQDEETEIEVIKHGRDLIEHSNKLMEEIKEMESGKELFQEGKAIVDAILKKKEAKELMEKGMEILSKAKENKEAQALLGECKEFVEYFKNEEKVKNILEEGKLLLENIKSKDTTVTREQIESLFSQGSGIIKEFKANEQSSLYVEKMKKMFFDIKEEESTRITIQKGLAEGKKWVESLKQNDPMVKSIMDEGEQIFNELKNNQEVAALWSDSKKVWLEFMNDDKQFSKESPELKDLLERGGKLASNVHESIKSNKIVGEITQKEDFKNILNKGQNFIKEVKSKQQLIDFLKQNKDFIKEIKNTIVPFITDQLLKVKIPNVDGVQKGFKYEIVNLVFAGLNIKPENVNVDFETETKKQITVSVSDFTAHLQNFQWSYKQEGFPYLKDNGEANANASQGFCSLSFELDTQLSGDESPPHVEIKITEIEFVIGQLEVVVGKGTSLKWLYNYLISVFTERIKGIVAEKIKKKMETHLTTLATKINSLVGEYLEKLLNRGNSKQNSPMSEISISEKIQVIEENSDVTTTTSTQILVTTESSN